MASILDNAILVGKETTYGTPATLTRAYEGKSDSFKRKQEFLSSVGFRGGMHTQLSTRSVPVNMGGEGTLEVDVTPGGFGLLLQSALGTVSGPTVTTAPAYRQTFSSSAAGPSDSWTIQVQRVDSGGSIRSFTHVGSTMTGWSLSQDVGSLLTASFNFDFQDVQTGTAAGTPTYPNSALPWAWTQSAATWNGAAIDLTSFKLDADLGFDVDRRFLRGSELKKKPIRTKVPTFTGDAEMEFESLTHYAAFVAGTIAPMTITWTGPIISGAAAFSFKVTLPAVQFQGDSPEVSLDAIPKQTLPFKVLYNGTDPAVSIETINLDAAL